MEYIKPQYSPEEVDRAGEALIDSSVVWLNEREDALKIVSNWRSSHSFPQNTLWVTLSKHARTIQKDCLVAQRIKRRESIIDKLVRLRDRGITLSQMQDLGGCRAIVQTVGDVNSLVKRFVENSRMRHRLLRTDDYIKKPKASGYRGVHLVYVFQSTRSPDWNGLHVEVQIRSYFMHVWATAVEMVDALSKQRLKVGGGDEDWKRFFALMGTRFAGIERCKRVPRTPDDAHVLASELRMLAEKLKVLDQLAGWRTAIEITKKIPRGSHYFVVGLDYAKRATTVWGYKNHKLKVAEAHIRKLEDQPNINAVLIKVEAAKSIQKAYPNYFLETGVFMEAVKEAIR